MTSPIGGTRPPQLPPDIDQDPIVSTLQGLHDLIQRVEQDPSQAADPSTLQQLADIVNRAEEILKP